MRKRDRRLGFVEIKDNTPKHIFEKIKDDLIKAGAYLNYEPDKKRFVVSSLKKARKALGTGMVKT